MTVFEPIAVRVGGGCPICNRASTPRVRPFCSERCQQLDLGRWLTESYRVPGQPLEEDEAADAFSKITPRPDDD
jgi:uncharacterized protein